MQAAALIAMAIVAAVPTTKKGTWVCSGNSYELKDPNGVKKAIKQGRCTWVPDKEEKCKTTNCKRK